MLGRTIGVTCAAVALAAGAAHAELKKQTVEYFQNGQEAEGYFVYDDAVKGPRPGVVVFHDWMGLGPESNARVRCEMLARLGYAAFAADLYGENVRPKNQAEASAEAGKFYKDRHLFRTRTAAALDQLKRQAVVDTTRLAAMGYCFGGTATLELARSGADLKGVVTFHGVLSADSTMGAPQVHARVLVLTGANDPYVPAEQIAAFEREMNAAGADWQLVKYSGAVHAFTNPAAGNDPSKGAAYNKSADERSWKAMGDFFEEIFAK